MFALFSRPEPFSNGQHIIKHNNKSNSFPNTHTQWHCWIPQIPRYRSKKSLGSETAEQDSVPTLPFSAGKLGQVIHSFSHSFSIYSESPCLSHSYTLKMLTMPSFTTFQDCLEKLMKSYSEVFQVSSMQMYVVGINQQKDKNRIGKVGDESPNHSTWYLTSLRKTPVLGPVLNLHFAQIPFSSSLSLDILLFPQGPGQKSSFPKSS